MADHIPFVRTQKDCDILKRFYSDSVAVRISLESASEVVAKLPSNPLRWLDAAVDGLHWWPNVTPEYMSYINQFIGYDQMGDSDFCRKPQKEIVDSFVDAILDACAKVAPAWLSVPQLPIVNDATRNKINRQLAESTNRWKTARMFQGKLILPIVFTHQKQVNLKTQRNARVKVAVNCFDLSGADGVWVAESTLSDQDGAQTFEHTRFPGLINFHTELNQALARDIISIGGPYWGMNLILWARGLIRHPAIGLGNSYQYHLPGGVIKGGKTRIAIPPLRRWAVANAQLEDWVRRALKHIPKEDKSYSQLVEIARDFQKISLDSRIQVARFYKEWFGLISAVNAAGRPLALYHDLSSAYVIGKNLPDLPKGEGAARKPYRIAKQFMDNCL